jgi:hypothetical protein
MGQPTKVGDQARGEVSRSVKQNKTHFFKTGGGYELMDPLYLLLCDTRALPSVPRSSSQWHSDGLPGGDHPELNSSQSRRFIHSAPPFTLSQSSAKISAMFCDILSILEYCIGYSETIYPDEVLLFWKNPNWAN